MAVSRAIAAGRERSLCRSRLWCALLLPALAGLAHGQSIAVPNGSFESPATAFVSTAIYSWEMTPQPASFQNSSGFTWSELTGLFLNTAPGSSDHIDNLDGNQSAYLFADPDVGLFQDYSSTDFQDLPPNHAFNALYTIGNSYTLTVAINGGGGGMLDGVTMLLILYYRDLQGNQVTVGSTSVENNLTNFPTHTHLTDFQVVVPPVKATDPWAGQNIGIEMLSTATDDNEGGYWDLDNVRLVETVVSSFLLNVVPTGSNLTISWPSVVGYQYQLQASPDLQTWADYNAPLTGSGSTLSEVYPAAGVSPLFFRIQVTSASPAPDLLARPALAPQSQGPSQSIQSVRAKPASESHAAAPRLEPVLISPHFERRVTPRAEPLIEPSVEPRAERQIEPRVELSRKDGR